MEIYMLNTGSQYTLYYNAPKAIETKIAEQQRHIKNPVDLGDRIEKAMVEFISKTERIMQKFGNRIKTRTSGILKDAAYAGAANLNYSDEIPEDKAKYFFLRIVKKEKFKSGLILGAELISFAAFYVPPLLFVPLSSLILGPAIGYQIAVMRTLRKGIQNISFAKNHEVSKLERIIAGEKGLGLTNPDLIDYRVAKGL